ncbi:MAG: magnesium/cobalt efflux protein [SAR86 cluster bacterium]|uniref:Magnesium/cobalt efflux protein n=1 Tax=SAR86 cluster bacterium TaxID=2030880 RepID=A0A2A4MKX2_9GAMM|nr:MAG: magnesium/cobalt efflux protein [SAR86 cluster bacterium]
MTDDTSLGMLIVIFIAMIIASAYFSSSETSMMSLNRYRLKHLSRKGVPGAKRVSKLLESPDKLISIILIGNNFVNFLAASIATSIAIVLFGKAEPVITAIVLTIIVLIFAEVTPKTIAALYPEKIAYPSSFLLIVLLKVLYPIVWIVNNVSNVLVRLLGFNTKGNNSHQLSQDELRTVVNESSANLPKQRHGMLINTLDLEKVTVNDIIVLRNNITGIDIDNDIEEILEQIGNCQHTRIPVYKKDLDNIIGILHMRSIGKLIKLEKINKSAIIQETTEVYYIPESTPLHTQLFNFQKKKLRMAVVVDEYGVVKGVVTLEDILEEIVGEFTTDLADTNKDIHSQGDGSYLIDGSANIRDINRSLSWNLDTGGAKTVNGLLVEILESIPESSVGVRLEGYYAEIVQVKDNMIRTVKIWPSTSKTNIEDTKPSN